MEHLDHTFPQFPSRLHHCFGGKGGSLFLFILSKDCSAAEVSLGDYPGDGRIFFS